MELRGLVDDWSSVKNTLKDLGATYKGAYEFTDSFFSNLHDLNNFIRLREYKLNNWNTKKVIVVQKQSGKKKTIGTFDTFEEAMKTIKLPKQLEFSRTGEEYELNGAKIFLEKIEGFVSVEIESESQETINSLFAKLKARPLTESLVNFVRKNISHIS